MDTVLVTGGAGFIGSHLVEALLRASYKVRVLDNLSQGSRSYLPNSSSLEFVHGDVTDLSTCREAIRGVTGVFHLAAMSKVGPSLLNPDMFDFCARQNILGTINILTAALEHKDRIRKLVYSGSSTYYGSNSPPHHEGQSPSCQTPYALSKYVGEMYCQLFTRMHGLPTARLRYFMTYGPREPRSGAYAVVTGVFMRQWENDEPLTILGDGLQTRDFVHVTDVAAGTLRAFELPVTDATINIGTGKAWSIRELAGLISSKHVQLPKRPHDIPTQQADVTMMRNLLAWQPAIDLGEYLRCTIRKRIVEDGKKYSIPDWLRAENRSDIV